MADSQNGNVGIWSGYTPGDNGWTAHHNANWDALDVLVQCVVKDTALATPPGSPSNGDAYIVPSGATGAWSGQTNKIAVWVGRSSAWAFYSPKNGWEARSLSNASRYFYNGSAWASVVVPTAPPSVQSVTSSATVTPTFSDDLVKITAQAANLTLANPSGTAVPAWGITIRIKDNGTARTISYGSQYRAIGITLPTTTVASKTLYIGMIYNADDTKWDVVSVAQEA